MMYFFKGADQQVEHGKENTHKKKRTDEQEDKAGP